MKRNVLKVHPKDNVLVALQNLTKGQVVSYNGLDYMLNQNIAAKHKFFENDMHTGDEIIMYGVLVGKAQHDIAAGSLMTTENTKHASDPFEYKPYHFTWHAPDVSKFKERSFNGYARKDGRVGTANYWLFIPTVFCENRNLDVIREAMHNELGYAVTQKYKSYTHHLAEAYKNGEDITTVDLSASQADAKSGRLFKNVDGIKFLNHHGGCGGTRQDAGTLGKLLAAYADHPNVAGVTVLSLGCQNLQTQTLLDEIKHRNPSFYKPLYVFEQQQSQS